MPFATITITFEMILLAIGIWFALLMFTEVFAVILTMACAFIIGGALIFGLISHKLIGWPTVHFIQFEKNEPHHIRHEPYYR